MKIIGKPTKVSKEEVRSIIEATYTILRYHNVTKIQRVKSIELVAEFHDDRQGDWCNGYIRVLRSLEYSDMVATLMHEIFHEFFESEFGSEKIVSSLTAKLKTDVVKIANILVENIYRRAGYFAHSKISYIPKKGKDGYNYDENHKNHQDSKGNKYRGKRCRLSS